MSYTLETDRLILKTLQKDSAELVLSFYEKNKNYFEPWEPKRAENFYSIPYQKASLLTEYHFMSQGKLLRYWVFLKDQPEEIIGSVCFQNFLKTPYHSCSLGYKISYNHTGNGYGFESISRGIQEIFDTFHTHRIEAYIMPNNTPSLKLIKRLKFTYEGVSYSFANINGVWTNHKRFSLINPSDF